MVRAGALVFALSPLTLAGAQGTGRTGVSRPTAPARAVSDSQAAPAIGALDGRSLGTGAWRYTTTIRGMGQSQSVPRSLAIAAATFAERPAWLIVDIQGSGERMMVDSLFLARDDLAPLHHVIHIGPSQLVTRFAGDSVMGEAVSPSGTQTVRALYPRGAMVNGPMLEAAFRVLPLRAGWRGTANMLGLRPDGAQVASVAVAVTGDETVTVPAGTFPSWVIEMGGMAGRQKLWLSKSTGQIVKVTMQGGQGMSAETVLLPAK